MALAAETMPLSRPPSVGGWMIASALLSVFAVSLGYTAAVLGGVLPPGWSGWGCLALAAAVVGGAGGLVAGRQMRVATGSLERLQATADRVPAMEQEVAARRASLRQTRHDIRGALSPALLASDRLLGSSDPAIKRSAEIVVRSVDRAIALLADNPDAG